MASPDLKRRKSGAAPSKVSVVLGSQWGDEGKGKLVDILAQDADVVARCAGGNNAGHTIVVGDIHYDFHVLPSGIVSENCMSVIGNGVVLNIPAFFEELKYNEKKGLKNYQSRLLVSDRAHLVFSFHQNIDGIQEAEKGKGSLGTTKKGIGPTYSAKMARTGLRVCDLLGDWDCFETTLRSTYEKHQKRYATLDIDIEKEVAYYKEIREKIRPYVSDTIVYVNECLQNAKRVLVEGANASMLDIDFGTYPYVTSSSCSIGGVCTGLGIAPHRVGSVYGVVKAYTTRVGDGAFPTEQFNKVGTDLQEIGREFGVTTGRRRRCGWLDLVVVKYTNMLNAYECIAITKLDVLDTFEEIKIGVAYMHKGKRLPSFPADMKLLEEVEVEYVTLPGWKTSIAACKKKSDLPKNALLYIRKIEEILGVPVKWVGTGPEREDMINMF